MTRSKRVPLIFDGGLRTTSAKWPISFIVCLSRHRCSNTVNRYALAPFPASEPRSYPRKLVRDVAVMSIAKMDSSRGVSSDGNLNGLTLIGMALLLAGVNMITLAFSKNSS